MKFCNPSALSTLALLAVIGQVNAADPTVSKDQRADVESVEIFSAMHDGKIQVQFIPKDASQATMIIENKGDKPLDVQIPKAFGAVHVVGQMGMGGMGMGGMGGGMGGMGGMGGGMGGMGGGMGGGQGMGGGMGGMGGGMGGMGGGMMGGMGGGMGGMGMGGGMMRVEPDKTAKVKVPCVCLEHGKKDPNPRMKYQLVPIEVVNGDPRVAKLLELLASGKVPQNTAQATAWHVANGLSWNELATKNRVESRYTGNLRYFNPIELRSAFQIAGLLNRAIESYQGDAKSTGYHNTDAE